MPADAEGSAGNGVQRRAIVVVWKVWVCLARGATLPAVHAILRPGQLTDRVKGQTLGLEQASSRMAVVARESFVSREMNWSTGGL